MTQLVSHHLFLCATPTKESCCKSSQGIKSWERLKVILKKLNLEDPDRPEGMVLRSKVDCLRICKAGPILLIWPEGVWYQHVSSDRIEKIIRSHVLEGTPIKDWVLKETPLKFSSHKIN